MRYRTLYLTAICIILFCASSAADYTKRVCSGKDADGCPDQHDILMKCNPSNKEIGAEACSIIKNGGTETKVLDFHVDRRERHEGVDCPYIIFVVTCYTPKE